MNDGSDAIPWSPDAQLERLITLKLADLHNSFVSEMHADRKRIESQLRSAGGTPYHQLGDNAAEHFAKYADGVIPALVDTIADAHGGSLPPRSRGWILARYDRACGTLPKSLAHGIADSIGRRYGGPSPAAAEPRLRSKFEPVVSTGLRRLEIRLSELENRNRLQAIAQGSAVPRTSPEAAQHDVMVSYAGEDYVELVQPLIQLLEASGLRVWVDKAEVKLGDSIYDRINRGLTTCRHAVVVLSPAFFAKGWTQGELAALAALQYSTSRKVILPIWHRLDHETVTKYAPLIAALRAVKSSDGLEAVAAAIVDAVRE